MFIPLVSVIIATYNSLPFVIETLESVSNQTWKELELIITDDCSIDNTVEVSSKWLNENRKRFFSAKIITSEKNTGVSANANRGLYAAKGDWIKFLGADDALKPNCIEVNMLWIASHPEVKVLFSGIDVYRNTFEPQNLINITHGNPFDSNSIMATDRSAESQYKMLLLSDRIRYTPSVCLQRETLVAVGGFDERFRLLEDYPLWLNFTKNGHKLHFMNKVTVNYRQHNKAINNTGVSYLVNPNYFKQEDFRKVYTYPYLPAEIRLNQRFTWFASQIFRFRLINQNSMPNRFLLAFLTTFLNPFKYFIYLKKRLNKYLKEDEFYM